MILSSLHRWLTPQLPSKIIGSWSIRFESTVERNYVVISYVWKLCPLWSVLFCESTDLTYIEDPGKSLILIFIYEFVSTFQLQNIFIVCSGTSSKSSVLSLISSDHEMLSMRVIALKSTVWYLNTTLQIHTREVSKHLKTSNVWCSKWHSERNASEFWFSKVHLESSVWRRRGYCQWSS